MRGRGQILSPLPSRLDSAKGRRPSSVTRRATMPSMPTTTMTTSTYGRIDSGIENELDSICQSTDSCLLEENRQLREELAGMKAEFVGSMKRRTMASVAGGGFRGNSKERREDCKCDALRAQLVRLQQALKDAKDELRKQPSLPIKETRDGSCSAHPKTRSVETSMQKTCYEEAAVNTCAVAVADAMVQSQPSSVSCSVQYDAPAMIDSEAQSDCIEFAQAEVEAIAETATASAQTDAPPEPMSASVQTLDIPILETREMAAQTDAENRKTSCSKSVQCESEKVAQVSSVCSQTDVVQRSDVSFQTDPPEDEGLAKILQQSLIESQAMLDHYKTVNDRLGSNEKTLEKELAASQQQMDVWQKAATTKVFGQLSVMVVCPKAECTIRGEFLEMTTWDLKRIQNMIEDEVIPRFTKVFSYEGEQQPPQIRDAIDSSMQEFAQTFQMKLSEMLSNVGPKAVKT